MVQVIATPKDAVRLARLERYACEVAVVVCCAPPPATRKLVRQTVARLVTGAKQGETFTMREAKWLDQRARELLQLDAPTPLLTIVAGALHVSAVEKVKARFAATRSKQQAPPALPAGDPPNSAT